MLGTWDTTETPVWRRDVKHARQQDRSLSRFLVSVDLLLYAAAFALVICVLVLAMR